MLVYLSKTRGVSDSKAIPHIHLTTHHAIALSRRVLSRGRLEKKYGLSGRKGVD